MSHSKQMSQALGQVAKSRVKKLGPATPSDRQVSEQTFLKLKQTIEKSDRWTQAENRDALTFKDANGVTWRLAIFNKSARLYLALICDGNGSNRRWESQSLEVGGLIESDTGPVGFGLTLEFSYFSQWRRGVMRDRPVTRPSSASS